MKPPSESPTGARRLLLASLLIGATLLSGTARGAPPCAADIQKFCAKVVPGSGRIQACLKQHEKELSPECATRHENLEKEMGALVASCRSDISRFCSDVAGGQGRVARCLERNRSDLSPVCQDQLRQAQQPTAK